jgi:hypothetical protein
MECGTNEIEEVPGDFPIEDYELRICKECGTEFVANRSGTKKYCTYHCKRKAANRRQYHRDIDASREKARTDHAKRMEDPEHRERMATAVRTRASKFRRVLAGYKLRMGCKDCGYNENAVALEFDHVEEGTKVRSVSQLSSLETAMAEMKKCEVVCANCHRIRTQERLRRRHYAEKEIGDE